MRTRLLAAVAGVAAVGLAVALAELVAQSVDGIPSLVTAVGALVVPQTPAWLEDWAIATFGTNDKAVLAAGTVVVTLAVGAIAGVSGRTDRSRAGTLFVLFTAIGLFAAVVQPLVAVVPTVLTVVVVATIGWAVLRQAWGLLAPGDPHPEGDGPRPSPDDPRNPAVARRQFLALVGGTGVVAVGATGVARVVGGAPRAATSTPMALPMPRRELPPPPPAASFDVDGLTPILVPNDDFYRIDTALSVPRVDATRWRLRIHGMVDRELELTYEDLLDRTFVEHDVTIACVSNEIGDDLVGNARWLGTPLADLLAEAGIRDGATQVVGRAVDGWTAGFPTPAATDGRGSMVAIGMNREPLPPAHGFPARLVVPGLFGYVSATKWLTEIELTTWEGFDAYWVPRGWSKEGPIKTQSRIDVPRHGAAVEAGPVVVAGVAWAPTRGIERVEVQLDDGPWAPAELSEPLSDDAWVQWRATVEVPSGTHDVRVRATDGTGTTQSRGPVPPRPDGAEGWHTVRLRA